MRITLFILILLFTIGCSTENKPYNTALNKVIDLFFIENQNEELLKETTSLLSQPTTTEEKNLLQLMRIGAFCELGMTDSATQTFEMLDTMSIQKNKRLNFWLNTINGLRLFRSNNYSKAYISLSKAISENYDDRANALSLRLLARIHYSSGDTNKATEWLAQSTDLFTKAGLHKSVAINHKVIGRHFVSKNDFRKAEDHFDLAEKGLVESNDSLELFFIYINMLDLQLRQKQYARAKQFATKSAGCVSQKTDRQALALLYNNLGEIEFLLNNYDSSHYYYRKTLDLPTGFTTDQLRYGNACIGISRAFLAQQKPETAIQFAKKALNISQKSDLQQMQYDANNQLAAIYQRVGNYKEAFAYKLEANHYLEKSGIESVENTETVYRTTINLLQSESQKNKMKEEKRFYLFMIIAGIVFTVILLIYGITTYRLMISRNQVLKSLVKKNLQLIDDERKLNEALHIQLSTKKLIRKSTDDEKNLLLYNELTDWLLQGKQYMRKDLTAEIVARELSTNRDYLSRAVSSQQLHFNELINKYRIEEAVKILSNKCDKRNNYNLSIISSDVGFKTMSVFIEAFRKQTGMNPAQFRTTACSDEKVENS